MKVHYLTIALLIPAFTATASSVVVLDHLATPALYENAGTSDIGIWGQTFISAGWSVVGIDVYIDDPTRPDNESVNELQAPFNLVFYEAGDLQDPLLVASRTIGTAGEEFSGLVSFDLVE